MAVLIDPPAWPAHGRLWAHLVSDVSLAELHRFAAAAGLPRRSFERDHYDVPAERYDALVAAGAQPVTARAVVERLAAAGLRRRKADAPAPRRPGRELLRPPRLRPGDLVAVTATAGVVPAARLSAGVAVLRGWGLRVRVSGHVLGRHAVLAHLSGTDAERAADFAEAWRDDEVAAVMAARGGYGSQRVVDLIDWRRLAEARPKVLVGFSDLTALHAAVASRLGLVTVHGHVVTSLGAATADSAEGLRRQLLTPELGTDLLGGGADAIRVVVPGRAEGVLLGGNLALLAAEVGTPYSRPAHGGIVLLEDVAEPPFRIDRLLTQLVRSGWFSGVRGVVLGAFTDCGAPAQVYAVLTDRLRGLGVPVLAGVDAGHTATSRTIPFGVRATLDADARRLELHAPALS